MFKKRLSKTNYDTIIFDLGQVIVDLDGPAVIAQLLKESRLDNPDLKSLIVDDPVLYEFERGRIGEEEFRNSFRDILKMDISNDRFDEIWNLMLKSIPLKRLELMSGIGDYFQTMILSNTNIIHERKFDQMVGELAFGKQMKDFVHHAHYSHDMGQRKPDKVIYQTIIDLHNLVPERTIFLDDRTDNVGAAKELGIEAFQVADPDDIHDLLKMT